MMMIHSGRAWVIRGLVRGTHTDAILLFLYIKYIGIVYESCTSGKLCCVPQVVVERFYGQSLREFCEMISKRSFDRLLYTIATTGPVRFPYSRLLHKKEKKQKKIKQIVCGVMDFVTNNIKKNEKGENTILGHTTVYIII